MTVNAALVTFAVGLGFFILAYLVAIKKWSFLIAGYNTMAKSKKEKFDEDTLCKEVGKLLFSGGGLVCLAGLGILLDLPWLVGGGWLIFIAMNIGFVIYANISDRYKK